MTLQHDVTRDRIEDWRRRLIDLTYRNRLIRYRPTRASTIEIASPSLTTLLENPSRALPWRFYFPPELVEEEPTDEQDTAAVVDEIIVQSRPVTQRPPEDDEIVVA